MDVKCSLFSIISKTSLALARSKCKMETYKWKEENSKTLITLQSANLYTVKREVLSDGTVYILYKSSFEYRIISRILYSNLTLHPNLIVFLRFIFTSPGLAKSVQNKSGLMIYHFWILYILPFFQGTEGRMLDVLFWSLKQLVLFYWIETRER